MVASNLEDSCGPVRKSKSGQELRGIVIGGGRAHSCHNLPAFKEAWKRGCVTCYLTMSAAAFNPAVK